jgi:hypothetical protein
MIKIKSPAQLKRIVSTFLVISAFGLTVAAQTGNTDTDRSSQIIGSGARSSQIYGSGSRSSTQIVGSGGVTASIDSDSSSTLGFVWNWFESIF